jgi:ABC-type multidrug transport system fused ATPase/permease subunit
MTDQNNYAFGAFENVLTSALFVAAILWIVAANAWIDDPAWAWWQLTFAAQEEFRTVGYLAVFVIVGYVLPIAIFFVAILWLAKAAIARNPALQHIAQLEKLRAAHESMKWAHLHLADLERTYRAQLDAFTAIQQQLEDVKSLRDSDVEDLKRKLRAIEAASQERVWKERFAGFLLGVVASLVASLIWALLSTRPM